MIYWLAVLLVFTGLILGGVAAYPYLFYINKIRGLPPIKTPDPLSVFPHISVVISAYQEGTLIKTRIEDILKSDYPKDQMIIYVVNDGADPATGNCARIALEKAKIAYRIIEPHERLGKIRCQNKVLAELTDEYIVFTDADIVTEPDALSRLIAWLKDPKIGAVCADLIPVGFDSNVTGSEKAYRSVYGKMCVYDSSIDSTYNFNGPLIAFKKLAVPWLDETTGADDANLALTCISNGYRAVYAYDSIAYERQPISLKEQYRQKIRRADGLVHSTRLFRHAGAGSARPFWKTIFPMRKWMILYSPYLFLLSLILILIGAFLFSVTGGIIILALFGFVIVFSLAKPANLASSFVLNQFYLFIGLIRRKNIMVWKRVEK